MSQGVFLTGLTTCSNIKKIRLKLLVLFLDEVLSLKNKSCIIEEMHVSASGFAYFHFYNNYVKIVSTSTRQTKLNNYN